MFEKKSYSKPGFGAKSGGKRFGGGAKPWERGSDGPRPMHSATCSECGNRCEVPFKPNGKKPIFCSNCFKKDDYDAAPKRSFNNDGPRERTSDTGLNDQFRAIHSKLDAIIQALNV